jgi:hypothetical protein
MRYHKSMLMVQTPSSQASSNVSTAPSPIPDIHRLPSFPTRYPATNTTCTTRCTEMPSRISIVHEKCCLLCQSQGHSHLVLPGEGADLVMSVSWRILLVNARGDENISVVPESAYCCDNVHSGLGIRADDQGGEKC